MEKRTSGSVGLNGFGSVPPSKWHGIVEGVIIFVWPPNEVHLVPDSVTPPDLGAVFGSFGRAGVPVDPVGLPFRTNNGDRGQVPSLGTVVTGYMESLCLGETEDDHHGWPKRT